MGHTNAQIRVRLEEAVVAVVGRGVSRLQRVHEYLHGGLGRVGQTGCHEFVEAYVRYVGEQVDDVRVQVVLFGEIALCQVFVVCGLDFAGD